jgi:hypothetical protein
MLNFNEERDRKYRDTLDAIASGVADGSNPDEWRVMITEAERTLDEYERGECTNEKIDAKAARWIRTQLPIMRRMYLETIRLSRKPA